MTNSLVIIIRHFPSFEMMKRSEEKRCNGFESKPHLRVVSQKLRLELESVSPLLRNREANVLTQSAYYNNNFARTNGTMIHIQTTPIIMKSKCDCRRISCTRQKARTGFASPPIVRQNWKTNGSKKTWVKLKICYFIQ